MNFPVPVGAFNGNVFQNPLYVLKIGTVDNRRMDFFCNVLLASVYIAVSFIPEMLCDLEIDHITAILLPCENMGQGCLIPYLKSL